MNALWIVCIVYDTNLKKADDHSPNGAQLHDLWELGRLLLAPRPNCTWRIKPRLPDKFICLSWNQLWQANVIWYLQENTVPRSIFKPQGCWACSTKIEVQTVVFPVSSAIFRHPYKNNPAEQIFELKSETGHEMIISYKRITSQSAKRRVYDLYIIWETTAWAWVWDQ